MFKICSEHIADFQRIIKICQRIIRIFRWTKYSGLPSWSIQTYIIPFSENGLMKFPLWKAKRITKLFPVNRLISPQTLTDYLGKNLQLPCTYVTPARIEEAAEECGMNSLFSTLLNWKLSNNRAIRRLMHTSSEWFNCKSGNVFNCKCNREIPGILLHTFFWYQTSK